MEVARHFSAGKLRTNFPSPVGTTEPQNAYWPRILRRSPSFAPRFLALTWACVLFLPINASAACAPFTEAPKMVGQTACIKGKVVKVAISERSGTHFLNFCEDYKACAFTVVVFAGDLKNVGDVRWLEGKDIEIEGTIKQYKFQPEIILNDFRQLKGDAGKLPPLPRKYDAATKGNFSAGSIAAKKQKRPKKPSRRGGSDVAGEALDEEPR